MMARVPFGVSGWEILISGIILVVSFIGMTWLSSKIYRVGILMYGKKTSWAEMWKWLRYKN
jgi:ABC-2 type transport system permease protein